VEVGEKKDRFVDSLNATRAAVEEGILPGGGTALLKASLELEQLQAENFDQNLGISIIKEAIRRPARTIADNAGLEGAVVVGKTLEIGAADFNYGFDAAKCEYTDMIQSGIVDPLKVVRTALLDASGVSSLLTTSECMIVDAPEKAAPAAPGGMGMGGMGGMGGMM
ncbi:chaperonin, partial [Coemansia helicoidea]